jgi:hypothetical protein
MLTDRPDRLATPSSTDFFLLGMSHMYTDLSVIWYKVLELVRFTVCMM